MKMGKRAAQSFLICGLLSLLALSGCTAPMPEPVSAPPPEPKAPRASFALLSISAIPGFAEDEIIAALPALKRSCQKISTLPADRTLGPDAIGGSAGDWAVSCESIKSLSESDEEGLRRLLEEGFVAFEVSNNGDTKGLFTGYYEAELEGSLEPLPPPAVPLYQPPTDRVSVDLALFGPDLAGRKVIGLIDGDHFVPYYDRSSIDDEDVLAGRGLELLWARDPVDVFFLHIQGSGRVNLPDGRVIRVGYAGSNGRPFTGIGGLMLREGIISSGEASAQGIRSWLRDHPEEARDIMNRNARYIFFREIEGDGPIGAFNVALTPGRSLAVDPKFLPLGAPIFLNTTWPGSDRPLRRLVVAQDTGSAIKGPVRGDLFWGFGEPALEFAGRMKQEGGYFLLLPRPLGEKLIAPSS